MERGLWEEWEKICPVEVYLCLNGTAVSAAATDCLKPVIEVFEDQDVCGKAMVGRVRSVVSILIRRTLA